MHPINVRLMLDWKASTVTLFKATVTQSSVIHGDPNPSYYNVRSHTALPCVPWAAHRTKSFQICAKESAIFWGHVLAYVGILFCTSLSPSSTPTPTRRPLIPVAHLLHRGVFSLLKCQILMYGFSLNETRYGHTPPSHSEHGASSANALGLTQQVPIREVYLTSGKTRELTRGQSIVLVKHAPR